MYITARLEVNLFFHTASSFSFLCGHHGTRRSIKWFSSIPNITTIQPDKKVLKWMVWACSPSCVVADKAQCCHQRRWCGLKQSEYMIKNEIWIALHYTYQQCRVNIECAALLTSTPIHQKTFGWADRKPPALRSAEQVLLRDRSDASKKSMDGACG